MRDYQIVTDACCDMNMDILEQKGILVIPMEVAMSNGEHFHHYPDFRNYTSKDFYQKIRQGIMASTSQISPLQYESFFRGILEKGTDILYVGFSSGLSGSYQASLLACRALQEEFPEARIISVDSLCACGGQGLLAVMTAENKSKGMDIFENQKWILENRLRIDHYFTVGNLDALRRGGRVPPAAAAIGNLLRIRPVMFVDENGKLEMHKKVRGRKASLELMVTLTERSLDHTAEQPLFISYTDCLDEAEELRDLTRSRLPGREIVLTKVGPVVGAHTGPVNVCLFSWGSGEILRMKASAHR